MFSRTAVAVLSASSITSARSATARRCLFMLAVCSRESGDGGDQGCFFIGYRLLIAPANSSTSFFLRHTAGADLNPAVSTRRFSCWLWLVGKLLILAFRPISLRIRRRSQPNKSGGPPLIALSLKVQRDIAHNSSLRTLLSVIGVHGVSKENASAKQAEKCYHNHRSHPYATLRHRSDLSASCLTKLVFQKWFHAGEPANNLRPLAFLRFCCGQGT
jgi:hypothetical protein